MSLFQRWIDRLDRYIHDLVYQRLYEEGFDLTDLAIIAWRVERLKKHDCGPLTMELRLNASLESRYLNVDDLLQDLNAVTASSEEDPKIFPVRADPEPVLFEDFFIDNYDRPLPSDLTATVTLQTLERFLDFMEGLPRPFVYGSYRRHYQWLREESAQLVDILLSL